MYSKHHAVLLSKRVPARPVREWPMGHLADISAWKKNCQIFWAEKKQLFFQQGTLQIWRCCLPSLGPGEIILLDADCHASIYDACRLGAAEVVRFRHNDVADLEKRLKRLEKRNANVLIVVEGIYSMLGDRAPLAEIVSLKDKYGAYLVVDEAHSFGVLGKHGRGLAEEAMVEDSVDFVIGTFSKSLGSIGGFCSSNHPELDLIRLSSRPYIFTASSAPSVIASTRAALKLSEPIPSCAVGYGIMPILYITVLKNLAMLLDLNQVRLLPYALMKIDGAGLQYGMGFWSGAFM